MLGSAQKKRLIQPFQCFRPLETEARFKEFNGLSRFFLCSALQCFAIALAGRRSDLIGRFLCVRKAIRFRPSAVNAKADATRSFSRVDLTISTYHIFCKM